MSLESQIAALVSAANSLTSQVAGKIAEIDAKVDEATEAVPNAVRNIMNTVVFVNAIQGDDGNSGSTAHPVKTVMEALRRVPTGAAGVICLTAGQVHEAKTAEIAPEQSSDKMITIRPTGVGDDPVLQMIPTYNADGSAYASFARAVSRIDIRFQSIVVKTGVIPQEKREQGCFPYDGQNRNDGSNSEYGGLISRGGGAQEAANFSVQFSRCKIHQQDFRLFTTRGGSYTSIFYQTDVINEGNNNSLYDTTCPKSIDLSQVTFSGFTEDSTVQSVFNLVTGNNIARLGARAA